jgi:hypothetical protein
VVKQSGIDKLSGRIQVMGLKSMSDKETVFLGEDGGDVVLERDDIFLIVRGRILEKPEREGDVEDGAPAVSLGKLAAGSEEPGGDKGRLREMLEQIEVRPRPGLLRWSLSGQSIELVDFYRKSSPQAVRMVESEFDYSGLGENMSPSGLLNYSRIMKNILDHAPGAPVDTTFNAVGYTIRDVPKEDKIRAELESTLGASDGRKKIYDNRALFDDFSARIFLHHLRERSSAGRAARAKKQDSR